MVAQGGFRKDLLFRLRALTIELPPLRQRPEDIEDLVRYHTTRLCNSYGMKLKGFGVELLQALATYYLQQRQWDRAYAYVERLARLYPNAPGPRRMLLELEALRKYGTSK